MKQHGKIRIALERFFASHGFALLVTICVAIIAATALWTRSSPTLVAYATPPGGDGVNAASLWQQPLPAATPTPLPSPAPAQWVAPLSEYRLVRGFSGEAMAPSGVTGLWEVHQAIDLAAPAGSPVAAVADGRVKASGTDDFCGAWIEIVHPGGMISRYEALKLLGAYQPGDPVRAGQTIGFVGNSHLGETDLGPHLHLQIITDGSPVDPFDLLPAK